MRAVVLIHQTQSMLEVNLAWLSLVRMHDCLATATSGTFPKDAHSIEEAVIKPDRNTDLTTGTNFDIDGHVPERAPVVLATGHPGRKEQDEHMHSNDYKGGHGAS